MGRHALLALLLLSLFVFHASDASFIWEHRKLVASDPKDNKTGTAPHDSPPPAQRKPDPNPVAGETKNIKHDPKGSNNNNISPAPTPLSRMGNEKGYQKEPNNSNSAPPVSAVKKDDGQSRDQEKNKNEGKTVSHSTINETCDGFNSCKDDGDMVACISKIDPKSLVVLIQNNGDGTMKVKLPVESNLGDIEVGKNKTEQINIPFSLISSESTQLTLNAGQGDCVLHTDALAPKGNFFLRLPSFDKILTPVNGAYFLILNVLVFGGTWACCKLRKKRHDEVPYQELEMALPESVSATNVESAEGWDQVWDDDWDDNVAVKSPATHHAGSISANGLTSRSSNKDGWENNWDD